ncbi:MAG: Fic family protein [Bacilli bacterium]|nr:Fic family protein [Bacilli bacterium]
MKEKYQNKYVIEMGSGLQDVDGLKNSSYFLSESARYIKGEITLDELDRIISSYYESKKDVTDRSDEADKVSVRIAKIISEDSFTFTVGQLLSIHRNLFEGILQHAGELRTYNFSKKEWVLNGASVIYGDYRELESILQYDFEQEKKFRYASLSMDETIEHLALFVANLWQIHAFEEGNTRAVAVFFVKYLRSLGFDVTNDTFAKNSWFFRNSLVRANYTNIQEGVYEDRSFLVLFLRNLLLNEQNVLKNGHLRVAFAQGEAISSKESDVLTLIKANPSITSAELAKKLGISLRTIKSVLKTLVDKKTIKRINGRRYGHWEIII